MMEYKARGCKPLEEVSNVPVGIMGVDVGMGGHDDHEDDDDGDDD